MKGEPSSVAVCFRLLASVPNKGSHGTVWCSNTARGLAFLQCALYCWLMYQFSDFQADAESIACFQPIYNSTYVLVLVDVCNEVHQSKMSTKTQLMKACKNECQHV